MMRTLGLVLLLGGLILIGVLLIRFGSSAVARASIGEPGLGAVEPQAVLEVRHALVRTVKYLVVPAALLLGGSALIRGSRRDEREHELRAETDDEA